MRRQPWTILVLIVLALTAYHLPWLSTPGSSLSLGAYDLAEWSSLHPAARAETPALLTTLLLRLPLALLALIAALSATTAGMARLWRRLYLSLALGLIIIQLPPQEFFTQSCHDPNYRQQFVLAMLTLFGVMLIASRRLPAIHKIMTIALGAVSVLVTLAGIMRAYQLMTQLNVPVRVGAGSVILVMVYLLMISAEAGLKTRLK